jgi:hypothetical protein
MHISPALLALALFAAANPDGAIESTSRAAQPAPLKLENLLLPDMILEMQPGVPASPVAAAAVQPAGTVFILAAPAYNLVASHGGNVAFENGLGRDQCQGFPRCRPSGAQRRVV